MTKLRHQQAPAPVDAADLVTKACTGADYSGPGPLTGIVVQKVIGA